MADSVELRMSFTSIKRVDPYVKDILGTSTHVALYKFNPSLNEWERTETEGALFLYSRSGEPWHSVMVMNRLNTNNLIEPIIKDFEYQLQPPFLLYRNSKNKIYGIWFYNRDECLNITCLLENLMDGIKEKHSEKTKKKETVDIFSMLSRAQEDFNNKTPTKVEVPAQPQFSSTPRAPDVTSQSVMDFFAKAGTKNAKQAVTPQGESENLLQRLMSNPAHSVEHIEKQQRSITPQDQVLMRNKPVSQQDRKSMPICFSSQSLNPERKVLENGLSFIRGVSPKMRVDPTSPATGFLIPTQNLTLEDPEVSGTSPLANFLDTPQKPQLMPPMMFASSAAKDKIDASSSITSLQDMDPSKGVHFLTKNQLSQAMNYLLKNDPDFVAKLHEAYVKAVNEKLSNTIGNVVK